MKFTLEHITQAGEELEIAKQLFADYQLELDENLCFQDFEKELENPLHKYGEPKGALIVAKLANEYVGCIALQDIQDGSCEMKRLYVKPNYRSYKIGHALVAAILDRAKALGYTTMKLDTLDRLVPALQLYKKFGFIETTAYYENPLPTVVYMEKEL